MPKAAPKTKKVVPKPKKAAPKPEPPLSFGEKLRRYRIGHNLTLQDVANRCGMRNQQVGDIERTHVDPRHRVARRILWALRIDPSLFFDVPEIVPPPSGQSEASRAGRPPLDPEVGTEFGSLLRAARESRGITQQELMIAVGVGTVSRISDWERGRMDPNCRSILKIMIALKAHPREFFPDHEPPPPPPADPNHGRNGWRGPRKPKD